MRALQFFNDAPGSNDPRTAAHAGNGFLMRRGYTVVPLQLYWKEGRAKLEIGLAKGKKQHDKRNTEKDRDWQRDSRDDSETNGGADSTVCRSLPYRLWT